MSYGACRLVVRQDEIPVSDGVQKNERIRGTLYPRRRRSACGGHSVLQRTIKPIYEIYVPRAPSRDAFRGTNPPVGVGRRDRVHAFRLRQGVDSRAEPRVTTGLAAALSASRPGDTLVVWKLDRLGRSLPHLVETVRDLGIRGVGFHSLQEHLDTTTSGGKLIFHIFASLAEFERDLIRERTNAGLAAARARGRKGGRPKGVDQKKQKAALALKKDAGRSIREICEIVGISRNTYYKYTREEKTPLSATPHHSRRGEHLTASRPT